jgi:xanthine/CO dehydrogenase XdhC/CoxF family maturation factor
VSPLELLLAESRAKGERVALATVLDGHRAGSQLLVWSAGHTFGDLGWPRLNQRVALYAEQLFERGVTAPSRKRFDVPGSPKTEISIELHGTK